MNKLLSGLIELVMETVLRPSLRIAKVRAAMTYLEGVKSARTVVIVICLVFLCGVIVAGGAVLIPLALCIFMPWQPQTKALVAASVGVVYLVVPLLVVSSLLSEKRWMRITGASELVRKAVAE